MKKLMWRMITGVLLLAITIVTPVKAVVSRNDIDSMVDSTVSYLLSAKPEPVYGDEWSIIAMARSNRVVPQDYYQKYYASVERKVKEELKKADPFTPDYANNDYTSNTDLEKIIIALNAIGKDTTNVAGVNLNELLLNKEDLGNNGVSELTYALIALDSKNYKDSATSINTRESIINKMLSLRTQDGGFSWDSTAAIADNDTTAMAVQALSKYTDKPEVKAVVDKCVDILKNAQTTKGDYEGSYMGSTYESPCTTAQVIVMLSTLNIDATKSENGFVKQVDLIDVIKEYYFAGGGFKNSSYDTAPDSYATDQLLYSLVAYLRLIDGKNSLYDMTDVKVSVDTPNTENNTQENNTNLGENNIQIEESQKSEAVGYVDSDETTEKESDDVKTGDESIIYALLVIAAMTNMYMLSYKNYKKVD